MAREGSGDMVGIPPEHSAMAPQATQGRKAASHLAFEAVFPLRSQGFLDLDSRQLRLEFRHDCRFVGCQQTDCPVCKNSRRRRCVSHISPKGYVDMELKPKCDATARVEVVDALTGQPLHEDVPDIHLEMAIIDGWRYDNCLQEAGDGAELSNAQLDELMLLYTVRPPRVHLLVPGTDSDAEQANDGRVLVPLKKGTAVLPELALRASSEAVMKGRKPPFRLLARAVDSQGQPVNIKPAVSDGFVITTRRTKPDAKAEIPHWDDPVKVLENIGSATVKKLENLRAAGLRLPVPDSSVRTVGQLRTLMLVAEEEPGLCGSLQKALGIRKDLWESVKEHLAKAIQPTRVLRNWFPAPDADFGLLFRPEDGKQDPFQPLDLLQRQAGGDASQVVRIDRYTPDSGQKPYRNKDVLRAMMVLRQQAEAAWWQEGHPGWGVSRWNSPDSIPVSTFAPAPAAAAAAAPGRSSPSGNSSPASGTGKRQADEISRSLKTQLSSISCEPPPSKRHASEEMDVDPLPPAPGASRRHSPPAQMPSRHSADEIVPSVHGRSHSTPPDFFGDMPGGSPFAVPDFVPLQPALGSSANQATGGYSGDFRLHVREQGQSSGSYGQQPGTWFSTLQPLMPTGPHQPDFPAFPSSPSSRVGLAIRPQAQARAPATTAALVELEGPRGYFWESQMVMQQMEAGHLTGGLAALGTPSWIPPIPQQDTSLQGLLLSPFGSPPSAFGSGPFQPPSAGDAPSQFLDPPGAEAGPEPRSDASSPRPRPSPFANMQRGPGAGPAEDVGEQGPPAGELQSTLSDVVSFPPDWMELANKLRSVGLAGTAKLDMDQDMELLVGQALSEPMVSCLLGGRPLGSKPLGSLSMLSIPLDSAILDFGALPSFETAHHRQLAARTSFGAKPVSVNDAASP